MERDQGGENQAGVWSPDVLGDQAGKGSAGLFDARRVERLGLRQVQRAQFRPRLLQRAKLVKRHDRQRNAQERLGLRAVVVAEREADFVEFHFWMLQLSVVTG